LTICGADCQQTDANEKDNTSNAVHVNSFLRESKRQISKGKKQKVGTLFFQINRRSVPNELWPFDICLLPLALRLRRCRIVLHNAENIAFGVFEVGEPANPRHSHFRHSNRSAAGSNFVEVCV
jgi:hypothetical protein